MPFFPPTSAVEGIKSVPSVSVCLSVLSLLDRLTYMMSEHDVTMSFNVFGQEYWQRWHNAGGRANARAFSFHKGTVMAVSKKMDWSGRDVKNSFLGLGPWWTRPEIPCPGWHRSRAGCHPSNLLVLCTLVKDYTVLAGFPITMKIIPGRYITSIWFWSKM